MANVNDIERLFKAHYGRMYRLAAALLHDDDAARDIVHDVFDTCLHSDSSILPTEAYLLRAVRNRCLNMIRDAGIHERIAKGLFLDNEVYDGEDWPDEATITGISSIVGSRLPEPCRRVVELRFYCGLKFAEVAAEMGISQTAVFKHLRHALEIIRKNLNENG